MLVIRKEQMEAFERPAPEVFENDMLDHLREHFPKHAELLGEDLRLVVRSGRERAQKYSFKTRHELYLFIDLMVMLGSGFDTDPQLPWAASILGDQSAGSATERIDRLYARAMEYLDRVLGPGQVFPVRTYARFRTLTWEGFELRFVQPDPLRPAGLLFAELWREKCLEMGLGGLQAVLNEARSVAAARGLTTTPAIGAYATYMFVFGHHFDRDPVYPLASTILDSEEAKRSPQAGLRRLLTESAALLEKALGEL
jgi:hypothetical protein